ncbi:MAG: YihY family inner membrane protein [Spirochaetia bacterium]
MKKLSRLRHTLFEYSQRLYHFTQIFWRELTNDNCILRAGSLAFSTLLALVPLTAFVFSLLTGFGAFEAARSQLQDFLFRFLIPTRTDEALRYIEQFIENSRALGVVGLLIFALTSLFLLNGISNNINAVWASTSRIGFIRKFMMYLAVIVIGTLLVGASFTFSITLHNFATGYPEVSALLQILIKAAPTLFIFIAIWLMVFAVPSAKVSLSSSLIGAAAGTLLWEVARFLFIDGTNYVIRISIIYGSLAAIPIFLIWLSLNWLIIFIAAEITYVHQHRENFTEAHSHKEKTPYQELQTGLQIYLYIAARFLHGDAPVRLHDLANRFSLPIKSIEKYIRRLERWQIIFRVHSANPHLLPQKGLSTTTVEEVLAALWGKSLSATEKHELPQDTAFVQNIIDHFSQSALAPFEHTSILDLLYSEEKEQNDAT